MKRNLVLVNLALLAAAGLLAWSLVGRWRQFEAEHRPDRQSPGSQEAAAGERPASLVPASGFAAIVDHHLFNLDRSNDLPEEPSEAPPPAPERLPVLMGTLGIGGEDYALMVSTDPNNPDKLYRRLRAGQTLDGYTLVRVEANEVVMRSRAGEIKIGIDDKRGRGSGRTRNQPRRTSGSASTSASRRRTAANRPRTSAARRAATAKRGFNNINLPVGTVRDGKRLVAMPTPFGDIKTWVEDKQDKPQ